MNQLASGRPLSAADAQPFLRLALKGVPGLFISAMVTAVLALGGLLLYLPPTRAVMKNFLPGECERYLETSRCTGRWFQNRWDSRAIAARPLVTLQPQDTAARSIPRALRLPHTSDKAIRDLR